MPDDDSHELQKTELDLIQLVQRARMMHDAEAKPSEVAAVYWIEAKCQAETCQEPTPRAGGWVLDTTADVVDDQWETIKAATVAGKLGSKSKVTTASRSGKSNDSRTLVVRTYDRDDEADVTRVRDALSGLGLDGDWVYESE